MEYPQYIAIRDYAMKHGWHHWQRIAASRDRIPKVEVQHCVPFNCPFELDAPVKVMHPDSRFIAELMAGGIHPPIEAIAAMRLRFETVTGQVIECGYYEAQSVRAKHRLRSEVVIDNSAVHLAVAMPMSYEDAIEYTIMKSVPRRVWGETHNTFQYRIVRRDSLPERTFRNAWMLNNGELA